MSLLPKNISDQENMVAHIPVSPKKWESPVNKNKRGPSTPLAPSKHHNVIRRKVSPGWEVSKEGIDQLQEFNKDRSNAELIDSKYQSWLLNQYLKRQRETIKFLELERQFNINKT